MLSIISSSNDEFGGICAQEREVKPRMATIMGTAIFMTAFLVEVREARPETRTPCPGEPRSFGFASICSTKIRTLGGPVKINIHASRNLSRRDLIIADE